MRSSAALDSPDSPFTAPHSERSVFLATARSAIVVPESPQATGRNSATAQPPDRFTATRANRRPSPRRSRHQRVLLPGHAYAVVPPIRHSASTREALFDAIKRKEVYGTTGTRIKVRVFGGWDFEADEVVRPDFVSEGYRRGVPMGWLPV